MNSEHTEPSANEVSRKPMNQPSVPVHRFQFQHNSSFSGAAAPLRHLRRRLPADDERRQGPVDAHHGRVRRRQDREHQEGHHLLRHSGRQREEGIVTREKRGFTTGIAF